MQNTFAHSAPLSQAAALSQLALPSQSLVRRHLQTRLQAETNANQPLTGNPGLIKVGQAAIWLYSQRRHVDSYPMLYTTLALAHPN